MVNPYLNQQIEHLELANYTFNDLFNWVQCIVKPSDIKTYQETLDIAHLLWYRVGKGDTLLETVPLKQWLRTADI